MTVTIVSEDTGEPIRQVADKPFAMQFDADGDGEKEGPFEPTVTTNLEASNKGQVARTTTQCGDTKQRRVGTNNWTLQVTALVTDDPSDGNLSLDKIGRLGEGVSVTITTDLPFVNGTHLIDEVTVTTLDEVETIRTEDMETAKPVYELSLTIGKEESD